MGEHKGCRGRCVQNKIPFISLVRPGLFLLFSLFLLGFEPHPSSARNYVLGITLGSMFRITRPAQGLMCGVREQTQWGMCHSSAFLTAPCHKGISMHCVPRGQTGVEAGPGQVPPHPHFSAHSSASSSPAPSCTPLSPPEASLASSEGQSERLTENRGNKLGCFLAGYGPDLSVC